MALASGTAVVRECLFLPVVRSATIETHNLLSFSWIKMMVVEVCCHRYADVELAPRLVVVVQSVLSVGYSAKSRATI